MEHWYRWWMLYLACAGKKSARKRVHGSLSGMTVFENQTEVDLFVNSQSNSEWSHSVHSYSYYYCY